MLMLEKKNKYVLVEIEFFGLLKLFSKSTIFFKIPSGTTVIQLKKIIFLFFQNQGILFNLRLLEVSIFSNFVDILSDVYKINKSQKLFLLPPGSGG